MCDAKCAVVFNPFYGRCQRFLAEEFVKIGGGGYIYA